MAHVIGIIGLGNMGLEFAGTLVRAGKTVVGADLSEDRRRMAEEKGAETVGSIAELCARTTEIILSLPEAKHVRQVVEGDGGILASAQPGTIVADASTSEADVSRDLAEMLAAAGHAFVDAPVSGGPHGAAAGTLAIMVGATEETFAKAKPMLEPLSGLLAHVGPVGAGNVVKLVNNLMAATHLALCAEGVRLAERGGVKAEDLLAVVNAASGRSLVTEMMFPNWVLSGTFGSGFAAGLMRKDVRLALELADATGTDMPIAGTSGKIWASTRDAVADEDDFTRLGQHLRESGWSGNG